MQNGERNHRDGLVHIPSESRQNFDDDEYPSFQCGINTDFASSSEELPSTN